MSTRSVPQKVPLNWWNWNPELPTLDRAKTLQVEACEGFMRDPDPAPQDPDTGGGALKGVTGLSRLTEAGVRAGAAAAHLRTSADSPKRPAQPPDPCS